MSKMADRPESATLKCTLEELKINVLIVCMSLTKQDQREKTPLNDLQIYIGNRLKAWNIHLETAFSIEILCPDFRIKHAIFFGIRILRLKGMFLSLSGSSRWKGTWK